MTSVAVVAHSGKSLGGGLPELRSILDMSGVMDPMWFEVESRRRRPSGSAVRWRTVPTWCSSGAATGWCSVASTCSPAPTPPSPSCRPEPRICSPRTSGSRKTSTAAVESACTASAAGSTSASINGERFAVMAGAGLDALMIRDADGALKDRFGRAAYVWTGAKNSRAARVRHSHPCRRRQVVQGKGELRARRQRREGRWAASPRSPTRGPTTVYWRSVWSPRRARSSGRERWRVWPPAKPIASPFVQMARGRKCRRALREEDRRTSSTVVTGSRRKRLRVKVEPGAVTVCVPGPSAVSTATPVPETWELPETTRGRVLRNDGAGELLRDAFVRMRVADGFSHARSLAYATSLVFVQATIALVGLASGARRRGSSAVIVRTIKAAVPGPAWRPADPSRRSRPTAPAQPIAGPGWSSAWSAR